MEVISPILPCNFLLKTKVKGKGRTTGSRMANVLLDGTVSYKRSKGSMWVIPLR